jgi:predicted dehydrogenase
MPTTTRRNLLRTTALAAASTLVVPHVHAAEPHDSEVIKFGIVGCGGRGSGAVIQALKANKKNHLTALGDLFPDQILGEKGAIARYKANQEVADQIKLTPDTIFTGFDAYKKVIDSEIDVVLLTTPPAFRPIHFAYAVEKNKHIFAEKPVCVDAAGFRSVMQSIQESRKKNLAFVDGFCWRYESAHRDSFPRIHDGAVGDIVSLYSYYNASELWHKPRQPGWSDVEWQLRNWLYFTWLSGDHLVEQAVHTVDKVAWMMRDIMPVRAWGTGGRQARTDPAFGHIWDHFAVVYEWADGTKGHMYCRQQNNTRPSGVRDQVTGTKGVAEIQSGQSYVIRQHGQKEPAWRYTGPKNEMYQQEHDELFASIRAGKPINAGARVANSAMMAILGRMAAYSGEVVTWEDAIKSKEDLFPKNLQFGPMETPAVPVPGKTKLA